MKALQPNGKGGSREDCLKETAEFKTGRYQTMPLSLQWVRISTYGLVSGDGGIKWVTLSPS